MNGKVGQAGVHALAALIVLVSFMISCTWSLSPDRLAVTDRKPSNSQHFRLDQDNER